MDRKPFFLHGQKESIFVAGAGDDGHTLAQIIKQCIFHFIARKEQGKKPFDKTWEYVLFVALVVLCIVAIVLTAQGKVAWF